MTNLLQNISGLLPVLCIIIATSVFGQADSLMTDKPYNSLRLGLGIEKSPFIEIGYSRLFIVDKGLNSGSACFYIAGQLNRVITENQSDYAYGGKIGFETAWMVGIWGAEVKYLTTGTKSQWFFTPRIGLSLLGSASLLYGINTPTKKNKLDEIGRHQISLIVNFSKRLIKEFK